MKFRVTLGTAEAPELLDRFLAIIGAAPWEKRYRLLLQQIRDSSALRNFIVRRHGIELTLGRLLEQRAAAPLVLDLSSPYDYTAFALIAAVVLINDGLSPTGKKRLAGTLQHGLNTDQGLRPLQNEVETATHLMHAGFDVTFQDLEGSPGFDFLASRDGVELEVECKSVSGDLGRQVHERRMAQLSDTIQRRLDSTLDGVAGGRLVRVTIPARLPGDTAALDMIAASVKAAIAGASAPPPTACRTDVIGFELSASPFGADARAVTEDKVRRFIDERFGPTPTFLSYLRRATAPSWSWSRARSAIGS